MNERVARRIPSWRRTGPAVPALVAAVLLGIPATMLSAGAAGTGDAGERVKLHRPDPTVVTFSRDVAPIIQQKCQQCHQAGSIAPMQLITYDEVRRYAPLIKDRVQRRVMPPWAMNPYVGIQHFKNDISLSDEEIATIVQWVDAGAPQGDPADLPAPVQWPKGDQFRLLAEFGEPDLVILTDPYTVPAQGGDQWWRPLVPTGLTQDRWVRAAEVLPAYPEGLPVTHHVLARLRQTDEIEGLLTEWAVGSNAEIFLEGSGKLMQAGSSISFEVHYYPAGKEVPNNQVAVGLWFFPEDYQPKQPTVLRMFNVAPATTLEIPPHSTAVFQNEFLMTRPTRIESFQPHMHLRGKGMSMEAIYPNGRKELLSLVDDFQFQWHTNYVYADDAAPLLPAGTILKFTVWYDNTANHPSNPHPGNFVTWGDRAADEMGHAWVSLTYLEQAEFDELLAARGNTTARRFREPVLAP
jgi:hypothetical protein